MKYLLLIGVNPAAMPTDPAELTAMSAEYWEVTQKLQAAGEFVAGERLAPAGTATSLRVRDGKRLITDGPFAETTEQLAGFYIVDVPHLDRALDIAAQLPAVHGGVIEVRPIDEM